MTLPSKHFALSACALAVSALLAACGGGASAPPQNDTAGPTLVIDDNVPGDVARGAVTFTFSFSESVGTSFTVEDVTVSGGMRGTLIKVNDQKYLLEVTPEPDSAGTMSVAVAAGSYADLNDNPGTTSGTHAQDFNTVRTTPPVSGDVLLASFDEATPLAFEGFNGAETSAIAAAPAGGSGQAGKIIRLGGEVWAGAKVNVDVIPLTADNRTISARVYSPLAGVPIVLKLENVADAGITTGDLQANETVVEGWQTLTWTVPANKVGPEYSWVVMLPNLGTLASVDPGETYYFDDIKLLVPAATPGTVLASFDETTALVFEGFNGAETSAIAAGPDGGNGQAGKIIRLGGEVWAGAKVNVDVIPLTADVRKITARVYSPLAGVPIVLKLENVSDAGISTGDIQANETVVEGWQTLSWNVPANKVGPDYSWVVMLPNLGTLASTDPGETYYFDDITLVPGP
ncbi:MAG: hypothetical protein H6932_04105 [Burkholderiaceae bacterium]|nr:hypothetical protein [Burkholderiaceae bacterium]